jgi:hypothetical protein
MNYAVVFFLYTQIFGWVSFLSRKDDGNMMMTCGLGGSAINRLCKAEWPERIFPEHPNKKPIMWCQLNL